MKSAVWVLAATLIASSQTAKAQPSPFDGEWRVMLSCPASPEGQAMAYGYEFAARVKDGVLHGERGVPDEPGSLSLDGPIAPDGRADLVAKGRTNLPAYALYNAPKGRPFAHAVTATFDDRHGRGSWTTVRVCTLDFDRR